MSSECRKDSVGLGIRGSLVAWFQYLRGGKIFTGIFCFHIVKPLLPTSALGGLSDWENFVFWGKFLKELGRFLFWVIFCFFWPKKAEN